MGFLSMVVVGVLLPWICRGGGGAFFFDYFIYLFIFIFLYVCVVAVVVVDFYLIFCVVAVVVVDFSLIFYVVFLWWWWIICVAMDVFCVAMVVMDYLIFCGFLVAEVVVMGFLAVVVVGFL